jgi:hypothetical protein
VTVEGTDKLALKEERSPPQSIKNTMSDFGNLEAILGEIVNQEPYKVKSNDNSFDLSQVHSQILDYPDFSD